MRLLYDENQTNKFTGIINEGNTCYMNSLLQTLYSLNYFRQAIYQLGVGKSEIILSLQRIFYNLQTSTEPVKTTELLQAFGWSKEQRNVQQDAGEFWLMLSDHLEDEMKETEVDGTMNKLFEGEIESVITCTNIQYESVQRELFTVLQVPFLESDSIEGAIKKLLQAESMTGEDQYEAGAEYGK